MALAEAHAIYALRDKRSELVGMLNRLERDLVEHRSIVSTYNFAKHLTALRWRTPYQAICDAWTKDPSTFKINPHHLITGPYN